ncbi:phospholipase D-like domain-containing protein [Bdellovibrionota bacterium FG-1]
MGNQGNQSRSCSAVKNCALSMVLFAGFFSTCPARAFQLEVSEAPTTTLSLTVSAIRGAQHDLLLNIYELSSSDVADALLERIRAGVHVEIIEEGQPVGGVSAAGRGIQSQLAQAMRAASTNDHFYEMTSHARGKRRFRYDHGKYAVIDGAHLLIGSENYSPTGNPEPGTQGNRGWEVFIHDAKIAQDYQMIFRNDARMDAGDLLDLTQDRPLGQVDPSSWDGLWDSSVQNSENWIALASFEPPFAPWDQPITLEAQTVTRVTSPDSSLSGLLALINGAKQSLDIQQMTFASDWGKDGGQSPLLDAVVVAARRGVKVRVLLNDDTVFDHPDHPGKHGNDTTVSFLTSVARSEKLDLSARIANIRQMGVSYIHNKGALVDGARTLISSINWNENSVNHNREAAVVISSADVNRHYTTLFDNDWIRSASKTAVVGQVPTGLVREVESETCPAKIHVLAEIGELQIPTADRSFAALSNTHTEGDFAKMLGSHGCILMEVGVNSKTTKNRYIQFRKRAGGSFSVALEGYTSLGQLYSIRAQVPGEADFEGRFNGLVYDGSGPTRELLGMANLMMELKE